MSCNNSSGICAFGNGWWWIILLILIFGFGGSGSCGRLPFSFFAQTRRVRQKIVLVIPRSAAYNIQSLP